MTAQDRLTNPLGFQVTRYRRNAETLPEELPVPAQASPISAVTPLADAVEPVQ